MKWWSFVWVTACLAAAACGDDPAKSVKIVARPETARPTDTRPATPAANPAAVPAATATPGADAEPHRPTDDIVRPAAASARPATASPAASTAEWRHSGCPPPPEAGGGTSDLTIGGPCSFQHHGGANCESLLDDFLVTMTRKGANGATLMIYVNVEKYKGPGTYDGAQMFVGVQDKKNIYRWSSDTVNITVGDEEKFAVVPATKLEAEPVLVNCTGPMNNYQCEGRGDAEAFLRTVETVTGTMQCDTLQKEPPAEK